MGDIVAAGTRVLQLDYQDLGYVDVDRGDRIGPADGYATEQEAVAAANKHVKDQAADGSRDSVAGAAVIKDGTRFEAYETSAKVDGKDVAYNLLYVSNTPDPKTGVAPIYLPPNFVQAAGVEVVDVVTGAVAPSSAKGVAADLKKIADSSAQAVVEESTLSKAATTPPGDGASSKAKSGPGFPWATVGKWTAGGIGGAGASFAAWKWARPWLMHAGPVATGVSVAAAGAGLAYGANKLLAGDNPAVSPVLVRRGLGIAGAVTAIGGGAWLAKAVKDSEYLARTPAQRLIGAGVGLAIGSIVAGELTAS